MYYIYNFNEDEFAVFTKNLAGDVYITFYLEDEVVIFSSTKKDDRWITIETTIRLNYRVECARYEGYCGPIAAQYTYDILNLGDNEHFAVLNLATMLL